MTFNNKSLFYAIVLIAFWAFLILFIGAAIIYSIGIILINNSNFFSQSLIFVLEAICVAIAIYGIVLIAFRYFFSDSYFKINDFGLEIKYLNWKFKPQYYNLKWNEIKMLQESVRWRIYKMNIVLNSGEIVKIPNELYLNTFRVNKIKNLLSNKPIKAETSFFASFYLFLNDVTTSIAFLLIFGWISFTFSMAILMR